MPTQLCRRATLQRLPLVFFILLFVVASHPFSSHTPSSIIRLIRAIRGSLHPAAPSPPFVFPIVSLHPFTEVNVASSDFYQETWS